MIPLMSTSGTLELRWIAWLATIVNCWPLLSVPTYRADSTRIDDDDFSTFFLSRMKLTSLCFPSGATARMAISAPTALGSPIFAQRTRRSCALPGSAHRCCHPLLGAFVATASAVVREDVLLGPAGEIEQCARGNEFEAGLGERDAILALQPLVEFLLQRVEIADIARRIIPLRIRQLVGAPVARLLLFRHVDVQQLLDQVLKPVTVGIGAHEPRCRPSAIERCGHDPEIGLHDPNIEPREVIEL